LSVAESYEKLTQRFCEWAKERVDIRAGAVIGSRARLDHPADEWADLDLVIVTTDPEFYSSAADWVNELGKPLLTFIEPAATGGGEERRVLFEGMLDVDFAIMPAEKNQKLLMGTENKQEIVQIANVVARGMRILIDKDNTLTALQSLVGTMERPAPKKPTPNEFLEVVSDFLYHAVFAAKHLRRGELWWTVIDLDCRLQSLMKTMIEWHALAVHGGQYDTWFRGRFLEEWADPKVTSELRKAFAHYDDEDIKRSLLASLNLFQRTSKETANKLNYAYPTETGEQIRKWIEKTLEKK
jgi:aminoglycoside 6-adenylyltransferase